jgi:hypothetical protein
MQAAPSIRPELGRPTQGLGLNATARTRGGALSREAEARQLHTETCSSATGEVWVAALEQIPAQIATASSLESFPIGSATVHYPEKSTVSNACQGYW